MSTHTLNSLQQAISDEFWRSHPVEISFEIKVISARPAHIEGYTLVASRSANGVVATIGIALDHSLRYALNHLLKFALGKEQEISVDLGPDFAVRGVVEGFYGKPWTHEQRLRGLKNFGDFNMNTYFLAPKDVPWQRFNWRQPFESEFLSSTQELIEVGRLNAIDIVTCVSPGLSVKYSDEKDVDAVITRYKQLFDLGARHFGLLWDDIAWELQHQEDIDTYLSTAAAHADFTNRVWAKLLALDPKVALTVCPMHYSGRGNEPYLQEVGRALHSRINLMWTGRSIISEYLDISDAVIFERTTLRPPMYWDNFPVNDGGLQKNLYIGPVRGREVGLHKYSAGLVSNPMLQFEMSQIPLFTIGEYLWNSASYNPDISWEKALVHLIINEKDRLALRNFMRTSMGTAVGGDPAPDLRKVFRAGVTHWRAGELELSGQVFIDAGQEIIENHNFLTSPEFSRPEMIAEVEKWLEKYLIGGEVLKGLGKVLKQCTFNTDKRCISGTSEQVDQLAQLKDRLEAHRKNLFGDQIEGPINELMAELQS
ncbi:MAG: beta-N-acetylglucosaminidase domain-containing protein [Candidatus Planktophila sp.]|nr:beta-N-acetylglucosaminidase domain-containing protein [Candidatus Planktophila sp.]